ncbi:MAG: hypothetical protein IKZ82_13590 [Clostridia bacterium]|nr:hypothetical protein [Clostridia bacterium]
MLDKKQLSDIGFSYVLERLEPCSALGEELKRRAAPYSADDGGALLRELENVGLLFDALKADRESFYPLERALMQLKDIRRSVANSREMTLSEVELFEIKRFLILLEGLEKACAEIPVIEKLNDISIFSMNDALMILDPDGMRAQIFRLSDNCSDELRLIRRERKRVDNALRSLGSAVSSERDELTAERTILAAREENEEQRLRGIMTKAFSEHAETLEALIGSIARLDFALAKAKLMLAEGGCIPSMVPCEENAELELAAMVNPMLRAFLKEKGRRFTPVSIALDKGAAVITGANMGGKSVAVKTLALNAYLALSGFPVFAEKAVLPLLGGIHLLYEDREDSRGGLSSFGGEMTRFGSILDSVSENPDQLVLLDEFARGTNPSEGSALVRAAVRYFNDKRNAYALITTHFDDVANLASRHYQVMGLKNADPVELEAALAGAGEGSGASKSELLSRFMDYGLFRAESTENPPRDALKICRALRVSSEFMGCVDIVNSE